MRNFLGVRLHTYKANYNPCACNNPHRIQQPVTQHFRCIECMFYADVIQTNRVELSASEYK